MKAGLIKFYILALALAVLTGCGGGSSGGNDNSTPSSVTTYSVVYAANGATSGSVPASASYEEGDTVTVEGNSGGLSRSGYSFIGWNTAADGSGTARSVNSTFTMGAADVTLYAQWTSNPTYSVTYDANGATSGAVPASASYEQGDTVTVASSGTLVRNGYTFSGWNTVANGSGTGYAVNATFSMGTTNVTLYAQWTVIPTYTVSYNANGATSGSVPASASYVQGDTVTVASSGTLVRNGYTFSGWNTVANGSGTGYAVNATFSMGTTNVTLYAQWTVIPTYTVSYNANGATSGAVPASASYEQGDTVTVSGNTGNLLLTDYNFSGWNTAANGTGISYAPGDTFTIGANVTLYAQWTLIPTYTVTYDGNGYTGGTLPVDSNNYLERQVVSIPVTPVVSLYRTDYQFIGWNTQADGSGITYYPGNIFAIGTADVTLYARWVPLASATTGSIDYMKVLGESGNAPSYGSVEFEGETYAIALENTGGLSRSGYSFDGWSTEYLDGAAGTVYKPGDLILVGTGAFNYLYPHWTANTTYTVTYDGNGNDGGTVPVDTMHYESGKKARIHGNTGNLVKAGYKFRGWNTYANGAGMLYNAPLTMTVNSNVTLYAQWTNNPTYTVTYENTGATSGVTPVDTAHYEYGQSVSIFDNVSGMVNTTGYPTTNNTKVTGWSYSGGSVVPGDSFNIGATDLVMTPNWGAPLATVMFNAGTRNGNLGGYYGAVAICRSVDTGSACSGRSKVAAFVSAVTSTPTPGEHIAWDAGVNTYASVTGPSGTLISSTWAGLFDGGIDSSLQTAGVVPSSGAASSTWWSGMYADTPTSARGEKSCYYNQNWSSTGGTGVYGRAGSISITTADWLGNVNAKAICSNVRYIICTCSE